MRLSDFEYLNLHGFERNVACTSCMAIRPDNFFVLAVAKMAAKLQELLRPYGEQWSKFWRRQTKFGRQIKGMKTHKKSHLERDYRSNRKSAILKTAWDFRHSVSVSKRTRIWTKFGTHVRHGDTPGPFLRFGRCQNGRCKMAAKLRELGRSFGEPWTKVWHRQIKFGRQIKGMKTLGA